MSWHTWIIIALVILSFYQYNQPEKSHELLEPIWGKVEELISWNSKPAVVEDGCPETYTPVCGNGITYDNICKAALADVLQVTPGEC